MNHAVDLWSDPRLVYSVAVFAVALLLASIYLFRRRRREGRQAGVICLMLSIILHSLLILLVPYLSQPLGGSVSDSGQHDHPGLDTVPLAAFEAELTFDDVSGRAESSSIAALPVDDLHEMLRTDSPPMPDRPLQPEPRREVDLATADPAEVPSNLPSDDFAADIDSAMDSWLQETALAESPTEPDRRPPQPEPESAASTPDPARPRRSESAPADTASTRDAPRATVPGDLQDDFAHRVGAAKAEALHRTGGNIQTEQAVEAALRFIAESQSRDGSWNPIASGAGRERAPLGMNRGGAGRQADTAITGLALLAMIGAGNTHVDGTYADNVYRGLSYLIQRQKPDGSMAGDASVYAANYSHGMAALAMCEAAAITRDPSAIEAARRAIAHTIRMQHPTTGGWRYTTGDPGDLSQAGWQAMVLDAGRRAEIPIKRKSVDGVSRFLRSVRSGSAGGLASYRPGEAASRTMTAEALATRLLIGETVPSGELSQAQRYLLQQPPGIGQDNYYYWYYATLALHQVQDDAWKRWNESLQKRLLATQRPDGSWPTTSVWGGYGGSVYTTSMATLCLETYYRHAIRNDRTRLATRNKPTR